MAQAAGITQAMLSAYERGRRTPQLETLNKNLDALGVGRRPPTKRASPPGRPP